MTKPTRKKKAEKVEKVEAAAPDVKAEVVGLPVHGYVPQTTDAVGIVNEHKQMEERLLRRIDHLYGANDFYDRRWLATAKTHIEQGFMALNRAVFKPQRITLPEDEKKS